MNHSGSSHCERHLQLLCFAGSVLCCAGCWQEVHYRPGKDEPKTPIISTARDEQAGQPEDRSPATKTPEAEESSSIQPDEPTTEVTTEELFGTSGKTHETNLDDDTGAASGEAVEEPRFAARDSAVSVPTSVLPETGDMAGEEAILDEPRHEPAVNPMRPSRTALAAWRMASRWSLAAAIYAKGQPEEQYRDTLDQALYAAELIGATLPEFPTTEKNHREAAVIGFLLTSDPFSFDEELAPEYRSLTGLAIKTHVLLLVYTPKSGQLDPLIVSIDEEAKRSGLPSELWSELVSMLDRREPFADVKREVLSLHQRVGDYLAGSR